MSCRGMNLGWKESIILMIEIYERTSKCVPGVKGNRRQKHREHKTQASMGGFKLLRNEKKGKVESVG